MNWLLPLAALVLGALLYNPVRERFRPSVADDIVVKISHFWLM